MHRSYFESALLGLAALFFGVMAGFFWTYSININPAMVEMDGTIYAQVQSSLNRNVRHPVFFTFFFGGGAVSIIALLGNWRHQHSVAFRMLAGATAIYIVGIILFTRQVNLPLNYYTESWDPQALPNDWPSVRAAWNRANNIRVIASSVAFVLSLMSLIVRA